MSWHTRWTRAFDGARARAAFPDGATSAFFENVLLTTADEIWERALSKSYCATLPASAQRDLVAHLETIVETHVASGDLVFDATRAHDGAKCARLPLRTEVAVAIRAG